MSNYDDLQPDLQPVIDQLRANRPEATALELDAVKQRVLTRVANPARRRTRRTQLMKSRLVVLTMLALGMLLSTTGAGLAVSGITDNASVEQYGPTADKTPTAGGDVLGDEDSGAGTQPTDNGGGGSPGGDEGTVVQPSRQVEVGGDTPSGGQLPFTGFAAVPILLGGLALLTVGLVLRRRSGDER